MFFNDEKYNDYIKDQNKELKIINLISSVIAGILVPLILRKLNQDPAIGGSVVVTTVTDVVGFFSFLGLATIYLI